MFPKWWMGHLRQFTGTSHSIHCWNEDHLNHFPYEHCHKWGWGGRDVVFRPKLFWNSDNDILLSHSPRSVTHYIPPGRCSRGIAYSGKGPIGTNGNNPKNQVWKFVNHHSSRDPSPAHFTRRRCFCPRFRWVFSLKHQHKGIKVIFQNRIEVDRQKRPMQKHFGSHFVHPS